MSSWDSDYRYEPSPLFEQTFRCRPFDNCKNPQLESGNRIIMPQSSFSLLITLPVKFPLFFKIRSFDSDKTSHCGVLEFSGDEGFVYMPRWMMRNLGVEDGGGVVLSDAAPSRACYMKLRQHAAAFVELSNPKAVLEAALRRFACVSCGDTIMVRYNERDYYLDVLEVAPGGEAVSLIDTDCMMDFAPPLDYVVAPPPPRREMLKRSGGGGEEREEVVEEVKNEFRPFTGVARRIDGTAVVAAAAVAGEKKREKDGGKLDDKLAIKFKNGVTVNSKPRPLAWSTNQYSTAGSTDEKIKKDGAEGREVREFRPFVGTARRMGGAVESGAAAEEGKEKFKAFTGRSRVLGGPFL